MTEMLARAAAASPRPTTAGTRRPPRGLGVLDGARLPLEPARRRPGAREPGRRKHVREGERSSITRAARARTLWVKGSGTDLATITPRASPACGSTSSYCCADREAMDDATMVDYLLRCAVRPAQPRPSIETLLHAFIPAAHVDHTHPDAVIALTSTPDGRRLAEEAFGDEAVWLDYQRPGFDMSRRIALLLDDESCGPRRPARAARARHLGRHERGELPGRRSSSSRGLPRRSTEARAVASAWAAARSRSCREGERDCPPPRVPSRAPRRSAWPTPTASCSRSTGAPRRSPSPRPRALPRSARSGAVPRPPDQHEAQAARRRVRPGERRRRGAASRPSGAASKSTRTGTAATTSGTSTTRRGSFRSTRRGRGSCSFPGVGIVTTGAGRGTSALRARPLPPRDRGRGRGRRARRIPLAQRERGVRDRVLAPRALQARPGAARGELAGRVALITGGASGIGRAAARLLAGRGAHVVVADLNFDGAQEVADELIEPYGVAPGTRRPRRRHRRGRRRGHDTPRRARVRRHRHPRRVGRAWPRAPRSPRQRSTSGSCNFAVLAAATSSPRARSSASCSSRAAAARSSSSRRRTPSWPARTRPPTRRQRRLRCTSPAASPRRAAARDPREHGQSGRGDRGLRASGRRSGRRSVRAPTASTEDDLAGLLP